MCKTRVAGDSEQPCDRHIASGEGLCRPLRGLRRTEQNHPPKAARTCLGLHAFAHFVGYAPLVRVPALMTGPRGGGRFRLLDGYQL